MTLLKLEDYMERMMKRAKLGDINGLQKTMARVWDGCRKFKESEVGKQFKINGGSPENADVTAAAT
jgi:hypothetical protein